MELGGWGIEDVFMSLVLFARFIYSRVSWTMVRQKYLTIRTFWPRSDKYTLECPVTQLLPRVPLRELS